MILRSKAMVSQNLCRWLIVQRRLILSKVAHPGVSENDEYGNSLQAYTRLWKLMNCMFSIVPVLSLLVNVAELDSVLQNTTVAEKYAIGRLGEALYYGERLRAENEVSRSAAGRSMTEEVIADQLNKKLLLTAVKEAKTRRPNGFGLPATQVL